MRFPARIGLATLGLATVAAVWWTAGQSEAPAETTTTEPQTRATDLVATRTLEETEEFTGSLGYGDQFALPGYASGTVTWVPEEESILEPGAELYRVDDRPTYWAHGDVPMYRELASGKEGADVEQLQRFLQEEGYLDAEATIDGDYGSATRRAVKAWQDDHDHDDTGRINATQLLFLPYEAIRVASAPRIGESVQGGVLEVTEPDLFVSATINGRKKKVFEGTPNIEVKTAAGNRYAATVESIEARQSQDPFGGQEYLVRLKLDSTNGEKPGEVTVEVIDILAEDVLAVPARALLALVEGGYAVEKIGDDGTTSYVAVEIGEFADGWVEVTGDLTVGHTVVVPE